MLKGAAPPQYCQRKVLRRISHESHDLARCSYCKITSRAKRVQQSTLNCKRSELETINCDVVALAHLHFSSACASVQTRCASLLSRCPFRPLFPALYERGRIWSLSRAPFAYLSGRWVTYHLQARRKACTTRAKPSLTASPPRSLHSPRSPLHSASEGALPQLGEKGASQDFPRVARSCTLLEMGTFPFLVSVR